MCFTLLGLVLLTAAGSYAMILVAFGLGGIGSAILGHLADRTSIDLSSWSVPSCH